MKKLEYIVCKNFKCFYGTTEDPKSNKIVLDGKNLLLYGENGSGKSSLYWALYTFFMSALRRDADVFNFFRSDSEKNWRNIYCQENEESSIKVKFQDQDAIEISNLKIYSEDDNIEEGRKNKIATRNFVENTILLSDFINYKFIFKTFDFQNYQSVDLFFLFEKELFYYMNFEKFFSNSKYANLKYAHNYWRHINARLDGWNSLRKSKKKNALLEDIIHEYSTFCDALKNTISNLVESTNQYLHKFFHCNYSISFQIGGCDLHHNGVIYKPNILLYVWFDDSEGIRSFDKAHIILNEAKLTTISLAIRFAMMDTKPTSDDYGRLLILDDLLISLDMSNRDVVLDVILEKASDSQIIMMTHDKALFELTKNKISHHKNTNLDAWVYREMYNKQVLATDIPTPFIIDSKNYLQKADQYLNIDFDYQAAGNYLRKECERILKAIMPERYKRDVTDLNGLITKFKDFCNDVNITDSFANNLDKYRMVLLNALSHDDEIQVYRKELVDCMNDLKSLNFIYTYEFKKITIRFVNGSSPIEYFVDYSSKAKDQSLILVRDKQQNKLYINNPYCNPYWIENGQPKYMDKEGEEEQKLNNRIKRIVELQLKFNRITLTEPSDIKDVIFVIDDTGVEKNIKNY